MLSISSNKELRVWWEKRRVRYNLILIFSGILSLIAGWFINKAIINFFLFPLIALYVFALNIAFLCVWLILMFLNKRYDIMLYRYSLFFYELFCLFTVILNALIVILILDY